MVLFFFLLDKGGQPIVGGYAKHDYTHDIQQVGEIDNPFNDDKPYAPTGILDGRLFEQLVSTVRFSGSYADLSILMFFSR